jgi:hypothetical protein
MAFLTPRFKWEQFADKPLKDAIRATFHNVDYIFGLLNGSYGNILPTPGGTDEFAFMMAEI